MKNLQINIMLKAETLHGLPGARINVIIRVRKNLHVIYIAQVRRPVVREPISTMDLQPAKFQSS